MFDRKISHLDFVHGVTANVTRDELNEFIKLYGLSQYSGSDTYKKDKRIFAVYNSGEALDVDIVNSKLLATISF